MGWYLKNSNGTFPFASTFGFIGIMPTGTGMPPHEVISTPYGLADGSLFQRIVIKERIFKLTGTFQGDDYLGLLAKQQSLIDEICRDQVVDDDEIITPVIIGYTASNGNSLEISALYRSGLEMLPVEGNLEVKVPLEFQAADPYFKAPTDDTEALNVNSTTIINNGGKTAAYPVLTLEGEGDILSLANQTSGLTITFNGFALVAGEIVTLDLTPGEKNLTSDVRGNLNGLIAGGSRVSTWNLKRGSNTLLLSADGEAEITDESSDEITDELGDPLLSSSVLNITTADLSFRKRYWSLHGVTA